MEDGVIPLYKIHAQQEINAKISQNVLITARLVGANDSEYFHL